MVCTGKVGTNTFRSGQYDNLPFKKGTRLRYLEVSLR